MKGMGNEEWDLEFLKACVLQGSEVRTVFINAAHVNINNGIVTL